jgi:hypothetical protein
MGKVITESPDHYFKREGNNVIQMNHMETGACPFLVTESFMIWSRNANVTHMDLLLYTKMSFKSEQRTWQDLSNVKGEYTGAAGNVFFEGNFKKYEKYFTTKKMGRVSIHEYAPTVDENAVLGRLWSKQFVASFWNDIDSINKFDFIKFTDFFKNKLHIAPNKITYEFPTTDAVAQAYSNDITFKNYTLLELNKRITGETEEEKPKIMPKMSEMLHTVAPQFKGNMMKAMGINPKQNPLNIQQRFALGQESTIPNNFDSLINNIITERISRPCIVVDVQPAYANFSHKNKHICKNVIEFINNQNGPTLLFVNAEQDQLTDDTIHDIKEYWEDNGFTRDWNNIEIVDKGFGYLRNWMDSGVTPKLLIKAIRIMYQHKLTDSRDFGEVDDWKKALNDESIPDDMFSVNWVSVKKLKQYSGAYIMGGGKNECLKEVQLIMNAFNIPYKEISSLIY